MAVTHTRDSIILTGRAGKSFAEKMKNPDKKVMRKRDAFLREARSTISVSRKSDGKIILK